MKHVLAAATAATALLLAGCSGGASGDQPPSKTSSDGPQTQQQGGPGGGFPGGSGKVVEVDGSTAQVQGPSGQVAVSWTDKTTFTRQVEGDASDVEVGSCVMVQPPESDSSDDDSSDNVTAGTVRVVAATGGECGRGAGGQGPQLRRVGPPADAPEGDRPSGAPRRFRMGAFGEVTKVTDDGFVVSSARPGSDKKRTVTVTTTDGTTYTTTEKATASAVKTGVCVTSRGKPDDTGAVTATSIAVEPAVDGECATLGARVRTTQGDDA